MEDLVAIKSSESIEAVAARVSTALGVALRPRESSYLGDPYFSGWPESDIKVTANLDPMFREGDPAGERWFSSSASDAAYLVWETVDPVQAATTLRAAGLDAAPASRRSRT